jgi:prepilin-type N-terminal cleavage/methylation domain-containing protein
MARRKAFTLIELLVVIAIIALLMSILMPALARVKEQARAISCISRIRSWGLLFKLYTDDNDGYFNEGFGFNDHHGQSNDLGLWMNALRPYYKDDKMRFCPTATRLAEGPQDAGTFKAWIRTGQANRYPAPNEGPTIDFVASYGINSWTNYMIQARGVRPVEWFWKSVQNSGNTNNIPVFADSTWNDAWPFHTDAPMEFPLDYGWGSQSVGGDEINHFCIDRHRGTVSFTFMDWSVRRVGLKELWTLKWHKECEINGPWTKAGGVLPTDWPQWLRKYKDY